MFVSTGVTLPSEKRGRDFGRGSDHHPRVVWGGGPPPDNAVRRVGGKYFDYIIVMWWLLEGSGEVCKLIGSL